jgi:hypothetical protein
VFRAGHADRELGRVCRRSLISYDSRAALFLAPRADTSDAYMGRGDDENSMKAKTRARPLKTPLDLSKSLMHFAPTQLIRAGRSRRWRSGWGRGQTCSRGPNDEEPQCLRTVTTHSFLAYRHRGKSKHTYQFVDDRNELAQAGFQGIFGEAWRRD